MASFSDTLHTVKNSRVNPSKEKSNQQFPWVADLVIKIPPVSVSDPRLDTNKATGTPAKTTANAKPGVVSKPSVQAPVSTPAASEPAETSKLKDASSQPQPIESPGKETNKEVKPETTEPVAGANGAGA